MNDQIRPREAAHDALTERGDWVLSCAEIGEDGYPDDAEPMWEYQPSYAGKRTNYLNDYTPQPLTFSLCMSNRTFTVATPGIRGGCPKHTQRSFEFPATEDGLRAATETLDEHEVAARSLDVREFGECVLFGACGPTY